MDLISVIVPIYNLDAYLFQCVSSIVAQTYPRLEIILVDDGSTDQALEICEFFRKQDSRIKVLAKSNGGLVSARKAGLHAATGKYIFYVDGDDWVDPQCMENYHALCSTHDADIVVGDYKREFLGNFVTVRNSIPAGVYKRSALEQHILPNMISHGPFFNHGIKTYSWGKLYRREVIEDLQNRVPEEVMVGEDAALLYPAIAASSVVVVSDLACYNYRQRPNSILKSTDFDHREIHRIATAFQYLSQTLSVYGDAFGFARQLQNYFASIVTIRSGGFLSSRALYDKFEVFGRIPPRAKLALYNSGSFGQHVYKHLRKNEDFQWVAWFDKDYRENNIVKMPVINPDEMHLHGFDLLIVPSFDRQLQAEVESLFDAQGLDRQKIRTVSFDTEKLSAFTLSVGYDPLTYQPLLEETRS